MPFGDGTGPAGLGPMTGRAAGYCAGYPVPGYMNPIPGRGFWGRGFGWFGRGLWGGRGWRHWYYATGLPGWYRAWIGLPAWGGYWGGAVPPVYPYGAEITPKEEAAILKEQVAAMEKEIKEANRRIAELEKIAAEEEK